MHIPDGFLDARTAVAAAALSAAGVGLALRRVRRELPPRKVPLLGLSAAFLFTAQMLNFPVVAGTSGHLVGGVLVAALLGPSAAIVVLTTVIIVQCFLFQDGGISALGANVFNMALLGAAGGYAVYRAIGVVLPGPRGQVTAVAFAGWCSAVLAAVGCAGQLAWSGTVSWNAAFPAMAGIHMLIGVGEGLIGALVFLAVGRARPDVIGDAVGPDSGLRGGGILGYGLLAASGLAVFLAPFASPWPDGLESVAARLGFEHAASAPVIPAPAPDYRVPGLAWAPGATAIAAVAGAVVVFLLAFWLGRLLVSEGDGSAVGSAERP
jgi:cobalt/nickel transport system permease protein